jgi:hypothetical protein
MFTRTFSNLSDYGLPTCAPDSDDTDHRNGKTEHQQRWRNPQRQDTETVGHWINDHAAVGSHNQTDGNAKTQIVPLGKHNSLCKN